MQEDLSMQIFDEIRLWLVVLALLFGLQAAVMLVLMKWLGKLNERFLDLMDKLTLVYAEEEKDV